MSATAKHWESSERVKKAEFDKYGDGEVRYDDSVQRYRNIEAIEDPEYNITETSLPEDSSSAKILQVIVAALELNDPKKCALNLRNIVLSQPMKLQYQTYNEIISMIISAATSVDNSSENLAELVKELAELDDLVNTDGEDLEYVIGDFWKRPVIVPPGSALVGEDDRKIWSGMPNLHIWIQESLEKLPSKYNSPFNTEQKTWDRLVHFCKCLSERFIQGRSKISSLDPSHGIQVMDRVSFRANADAQDYILAAVYVVVYGRELYQICKNELRLNRSQPNVSEQDEKVSFETWKQWSDAFKMWAASSAETTSRDMAGEAVKLMGEIDDSM